MSVPFGHEFKNSVAVQIWLVHSQPLTSSPLTSTLLCCFSSPNSSRRVDIPTFPIEAAALTRVPYVGCVQFHCSAERSYLATGHLLGPLKQLLGNRWFRSNKKVETTTHKWLQARKPDFYGDGIFNSWKVFTKFRKAVKSGKICRRLAPQVRRSLKYEWYILMWSIFHSTVILCTKIVFV